MDVNQNMDEDVNVNSNTNLQDVPYVGMVLPTEDHAYDIYNFYALNKGFSIRRSSTSKSNKTCEVKSRKFVCSKKGFNKPKDKPKDKVDDSNDSPTEVPIDISQNSHPKRKRVTRTGCKAKLCIVKENDRWKVTKFDDNHTHDMSTPGQTSKLRSHNKFHKSDCAKSLIGDLHDKNIPTSTIAKVVNIHGSGENEIITRDQCYNHIHKLRTNNVGKEFFTIIEEFENRQNLDPEFYFNVEIGADGVFRSIFWADSRSRKSYLEFHDVVIFDVTYKTNKFLLPFAPFTGINHHRQSTLFGCALLADETEETFVWLFNQWLKCMYNIPPQTIITDQDHAICNAIEKVFPHTWHRYCSWHLRKHIDDHFGNNVVRESFWKWYECKCVLEYERLWVDMVNGYNLQEDAWLMNLYEKKTHWVPAHLLDVFTAGCKSSQRSESINSFFKTYVNEKTTLNNFMTQYDRALVDRRRAEKNADIHTMNSSPQLETTSNIEAKAAKFYTHSLFSDFLKEFRNRDLYHKQNLNKNTSRSEYRIGIPGEDITKWEIVSLDKSDGLISLNCSCKKFEREGMLCGHIFALVSRKMIMIPEKYFLKRWTIEARYVENKSVSTQSYISNVGLGCDRVTPLMMYSLRADYEKLFKEASVSHECYTTLKQVAIDLCASLKKKKPIECDDLPNENSTSLNATSSLPLSQILKGIIGVSVRDPIDVAKTKGRPKKSSRLKSSREINEKKEKNL